MDKTIAILLATYNGEKYLRRQLDSLLAQTYTNWQLLIRDDISGDGTNKIIEEYRNQYPSKISVINNEGENVGSVLNFSSLLSSALEYDYIMFCDQDDVWLPDKVEKTHQKMRALEIAHGNDKPLLVFTDFLYVDERLQPIESKKDFHVTKFKDVRLARLFAQNHIYGCTMMLNNALAKAASPIPAEAENHDYWVAIVAAAFGIIFYIDERTVLYRQHSRNVSGNFDNNSFTKRFQRNVLQRRNVKDMIAKHVMLLVFRQRYGLLMSAKEKKTTDDFIHFYNNKSIKTILKNIRNGVRSQTLIQTLLVYATILFLPKKKVAMVATENEPIHVTP